MDKRSAIVLLAACLTLGACGKSETDSIKTENKEESSEVSGTSYTVKTTPDASNENESENADVSESQQINEEEANTFISIKDVLRSIDDSFTSSKYWASQGIEAYKNDRVFVINDSFFIRYPSEGLYLFSEEYVDENEMSKAGCSIEDLKPWFENGCTLIFPSKFSLKDTQYLTYIQEVKGFSDKERNLNELIEAGDEKTNEILNTLKESYQTDETETVFINGIEYATIMGETPSGVGESYFTVLDGNMILVNFDSWVSADYLQETIDYKNYIMNSIYPMPIAIEELNPTQAADSAANEETAAFWDYIGTNSSDPDYGAVIARTLELQYPREQINVFAFWQVEDQEAEAAGITSEVLESSLFSLNTDALIFPKKYTFDDYQYTCYLRTVPGMFEKGVELADLRNSGNEKLMKLLEKYGVSGFSTHNGVEYANALINTANNGMIILDLTVADGNLIALAYDFTTDYYDELMAFRGYLLDSIVRAE